MSENAFKPVGQVYPTREEPLTRPPVKRPRRYTPADYIAHLRYTRGVVSDCARSMGVRRQSVQSAIKHHPEVREVYEEESETLGDEIERKLMQRATTWDEGRGDPHVQMFFLTTKFKDRGYSQRREIITPDDQKPLDEMTSEEFAAYRRNLYAAAEE